MDELIVPSTSHPHSRPQASYDKLVNNSETESSSLLIYGSLGNLYQQENRYALKERRLGQILFFTYTD